MTNQPPVSRNNLLDWSWPAPSSISASSFGEILEAIRPWISRALLDDPCWERMLACTRALPADTANLFGFEYQLQHPSPAADLCIAIGLYTPLARYYVIRGKAADADAAAAAFAEVLLESERDGSFLSRVIGGAIVEYDFSTDSGPLSPGIFLACPEFLDHRNRGHTNPGVLTAALAAATARPECDTERRAVEMLFDTLPAGACIHYAGTFPGREARGVRLLVAGVEASAVPDMLERVNWPGSADAVAAAVAAFCDLTPHVTVAVDVGPDGVSPRLGLEMFQSPRLEHRFASSTEVWHRFIDRLAERDLCLPEKADGLREAARTEIVSDPASGLRVRKGIYHFKIALHGDDIQAKAYVFFTTKHPPPTVDVLRLFD